MSDYRDVTPNQNPESLQTAKEVVKYIIDYLKHPIQKIKTLPDWKWSTLIIALVVLAMISGVVSGMVPPNIYRIGAGIIFAPFVALIMTGVGSGFIYYYFQVFEKRTCSFRKIFTLILFANIPFFIFQTGSEIIPPISLVGFAFTALLMAVGLTENFQMEKRRSLRLVTIIFAAVFILWLYNRIEVARM